MKRKPRVAHVTTIAQSLHALLLGQMIEIKKNGYEVYGISSDGEEVNELVRCGIKHIAVDFKRKISPVADIRTVLQLRRIFKHEEIDIVHTHTPKGTLLGQIAARWAGASKIISTSHGYYFHENTPWLKRRVFIWIERFGAMFTDVIYSQNREDIHTAIEENICKPDKIRFLGNGIDVNFFDPAKVSQTLKESLKKELSIERAEKIVGFVGRLAAVRKGFADFIKAAELLIQENSKIKFIVIGEADHGRPDAIEPSDLEGRPINNHFIFLGKQPNDYLPQYYSIMDVFVLPSLFEGVPRVIMEASAMGVPTVATNVRGNREAVVENYNGNLVPWRDVHSLKKAISAIITNDDYRQKLSIGCRKLALSNFDEKEVFKKVLEAYDEE